jgi:hypothetical protein
MLILAKRKEKEKSLLKQNVMGIYMPMHMPEKGRFTCSQIYADFLIY